MEQICRISFTSTFEWVRIADNELCDGTFETGFTAKGNWFETNLQRKTTSYLTNSLEESHPDAGTLFSNWLSTEGNEANHIKRDTPVMCVIGNPPYSGESSNKGKWIMDLMEDYKKEPGAKGKIKRKKS